MNIRSIIRNVLIESFKRNPATITVYHGTNPSYADDIAREGLKAGSKGYWDAKWFMVSTDFESALYHATAEEGGEAVVFEFEVPVDNSKWKGFPYFWPSYERSSKSNWYALKQPIEKELIKDIHHVSYEDFLSQKSKKY